MPFTRQHFDEEIEELRTQLLLMGTATEEMVRDAVAALTQQDLALAESIIPRDDVVDQMDQEIEAKCLRLLARQQPLASDCGSSGRCSRSSPMSSGSATTPWTSPRWPGAWARRSCTSR
jgi:phosphate uptake regulator